MRKTIHANITRTAQGIAQSAGATAEVLITRGYDITMNDMTLTAAMVPTLGHVVGAVNVQSRPAGTAAEDFSRFAERAPGFFFNLGVTPAGVDQTTATNHSPLFQGDDAALPIGVRLMANVALDYLSSGRTR